jgi:hypothetical protein
LDDLGCYDGAGEGEHEEDGEEQVAVLLQKLLPVLHFLVCYICIGGQANFFLKSAIANF